MPAASSPGHEHQFQRRPAQPGRLHQQERAEQRRAEQRADGREAARGGQHGRDPGRRVLLGQPHRDHAQAAAQRDQRGLRAEHHAQAQRGQGGQHHAGKLRGPGRPLPRLEAVGRRVAAPAGQVADGQPDQDPGDRQRQQRPPRRLALEAHGLGQVGEHPALRLAGQGQEAPGGRRDRHAEQRGQHQQDQVPAGAQRRQRVGGGRRRAAACWCTRHNQQRCPAARAAASPARGEAAARGGVPGGPRRGGRRAA